MSRSRRTWYVVRSLFPFVFAFLRDRRRWLFFGAPRPLPYERQRERARRLVDTIGRLGPTYIKLAQVFSSRSDIIREPYLSEIGRLQDAVAPVPVEEIEEVLRSELGTPVEVAFDRFDRVPLAAASLGQVHRARYRGEEIAVKVLRPGVEALVALDLDIAFRILFLLNILFRNHHIRALTTVVSEFERRIGEEMDLRREAENTEAFRRNFADDPRVRAPRVLEHFTRRRVLVTEFIEGTKVDRLESLFEQQSISFEQLMERLTEVYIRMMLIDGTLHADPHPGNILVDSAGTIIFLDFGMVVQIQRSTRERVFRMALAAAREDIDGIINGMFELGMIDPEISRSEIRAAALEIITILQGARGAEPRRIQEMVQEILDTFYTWPLILPEELVYFFRAAALLEGIGFRYDPHFLGMDAIKPVVQRMRGELLEATTREPRAIVHDLLEEARQGIRAVQDLVRRAEREELRLRAHPRDVLHAERVAGLLVRRLLLGLFASVMAIVSTLMFVATRSWIVLAIGNGVAIFLFLVVLVVPKHLLEYPLRDSHGRSRRRSAGV